MEDNTLEIKRKVEEYQLNSSPTPLVSIVTVTYKQERYIRECLDSLLAQETNFDFEILLGEDNSPDSTRQICMEYAEKYPDKIRLFLHHRENVISIDGVPTGRFNFIYNLTQARGKYIAVCEGDDYWTDPLKLQKQVDFLESHPKYTICVHNSNVVDKEGKRIDDFSNRPKRLEEDALESHQIPTEKVLLNNIALFHTSSYFFRRTLDHQHKLIRGTHIKSGDFVLLYGLLNKGKCYYMSDTCSSYRMHGAGVTSAYRNKAIAETYRSYIALYELYLNEFPTKYRSIFEYKIAYYQYLIAENNYSKILNKWYSRFTLTYFRVRKAKSKWKGLQEKVKNQFGCVE
ncbi:MAG: glycosyltransferase [Aureispira sp.]|nr:glycosyltransferase [Aureispira sp.]